MMYLPMEHQLRRILCDPLTDNAPGSTVTLTWKRIGLPIILVCVMNTAATAQSEIGIGVVSERVWDSECSEEYLDCEWGVGAALNYARPLSESGVAHFVAQVSAVWFSQEEEVTERYITYAAGIMLQGRRSVSGYGRAMIGYDHYSFESGDDEFGIDDSFHLVGLLPGIGIHAVAGSMAVRIGVDLPIRFGTRFVRAAATVSYRIPGK